MIKQFVITKNSHLTSANVQRFYSQFLSTIWLTTITTHNSTYESAYYAETSIVCKLFNKQFYTNNNYLV